MDLSLFLSKLIGLYLIIVALIWTFRKHDFETSSKELWNAGGTLALSGVVSLLIGLAIVIDHNMWELSYRGLITLLGWLIILSGVMRLGFPKSCHAWAHKIFHYRIPFIIILLVLGCFLTYKGFML